MRFSYVWEYEVPPEAEPRFLTHYAPDGTWARLFRRATGYAGTQLYRNRLRPGHYLTVDHWHDEAAYRAFRQEFTEEFEALDRACAALTRREAHLGDFEPVESSSPAVPGGRAAGGGSDGGGARR